MLFAAVTAWFTWSILFQLPIVSSDDPLAILWHDGYALGVDSLIPAMVWDGISALGNASATPWSRNKQTFLLPVSFHYLLVLRSSVLPVPAGPFTQCSSWTFYPELHGKPWQFQSHQAKTSNATIPKTFYKRLATTYHCMQGHRSSPPSKEGISWF